MIGVVPESLRSRGARRGQTLEAMVGSELRIGRLASGLTLKRVGDAVGLSAAEISRIEHGQAPWLTIRTSSTIAAVVGLTLWMRLYPGGDPLRDASHVALLTRVRALIATSLAVRSEVPLPIARDLRAWDLVVSDGTGSVAIEAETRIGDVQALARRLALKRRDGQIDRVILVVADTRANRSAIRAVRELLRADYPLDGAAIAGALRSGHLPAACGIWFV